jgi:cyanophycinase
VPRKVISVGTRTRRASRLRALAGAALLLTLPGWGCGLGGARAILPGGPAGPVVGPSSGIVMPAGGGALGPEIWERFVALAGGPEARIVVIPTAGTEEEFPPDWSGFSPLRAAGAAHVTVLHTRDRREADSREFVEPLRSATGVWIPGGRQWRLVDSYLNTRTQRELQRVLTRGGIVGGTSAGASILASYLVRGSPESNTIVMAPGYEEGFSFLRNAAVDQHLLARGREMDMLQILAEYPHLVGIGLDEGTAIVVRGDRGEVVGRSRVAIYDGARGDAEPFFFLSPGEIIDLSSRTVVSPSRPAEEGASAR